MKKCLKKRYTALTMKGMPWRPDVELNLDRYYVEGKMKTYSMKWGKRYFEQEVSPETIFENYSKDSVPTRILVQGGPGSGKTTMANKLAYDWANDKPNIPFDIVLKLSAAECSNSLKDTLTEAVAMPDLIESPFDVIKNTSNVLLIIDNYESITDEAEDQLLPVIRKEQLSHATVVLLSRSNKLTSSKGEFHKIHFKAHCSGMDMVRFVDRHMTMNSLSEEQQIRFMDYHLRDVNEPHKTEITEKTKKILQLWNAESLISPLELLLLIDVLTGLKNEELTLTTIHKKLFTLMLQRYLSRKDRKDPLPVNNIDLFDVYEKSITTVVLPFGEFAMKILSLNKCSFFQEEVLKKGDDHSVLDLGFVSERINVEGIRHKVMYFPLNNTLLEFGTAYYFWYKFKTKGILNPDEWRQLRPRLNTTSPLWFSFLVGLLQNESINMFDELKPFASEYSNCFASLCYSLMEIPPDERLQKAIYPMLPVLWKIPWEDNLYFHQSPSHAELLRYGLESVRIKIIRWNVMQAANFSTDVNVDTLMLEFEAPIQKSTTMEYRFSCKDLRCLISGDFGNTDNWKYILENVLLIKYKCISFEVKEESSHSLLPLICEEILTGKLKDEQVMWLTCNILQNKHELIGKVTKLVEANRLAGLQLALCDTEDTSELPSGTNGKGRNAANGEMNKLIEAAAGAKRMKRLVIVNSGEKIAIDLLRLCHTSTHCLKVWKWIQLMGVKVECSNYAQTCENCSKTFPKLRIQSLDVTNTLMSKSTSENLMKYFKVKSLASRMTLLKSAKEDSPIRKSLKGLDVKIDECAHDETLVSRLQYLDNLQVLSLTMAALDKDPIPFKKWIMGTHNFLNLKGIEIWGIEVNPQLAKHVVRSVAECVNGSPSLVEIPHLRRSSALPPLQLKLQYLLVNVGSVKSVQDDESISGITTFVDLLCDLKDIVKEKLLPRLEIVCMDNVLKQIARVKPKGFTSWVDVFPEKEKFHVAHDFWGMSEEGPYRSREIYNSCPGEYNRFCVSAR